MQRDYFVEGTERLVNPVTAGSVHFLQQFFGTLPKGVQRRVMSRSSKTTPYMGFVVDPYALFVFWEVRDDQASGLRAPSAPHSVVTTTADGRVMVDVRDQKDERASKYDVTLNGTTMRRLDERLWLEGNLSIGYGPQLSPEDPAVFSLTFRPEEMTEALDVPTSALEHASTSWHDEMLEEAPARVVCFPFAQHLLCDSPGSASETGSVEELRLKAEGVDFDKVASFSMASTRKAVVASALASLALIAGLVVALALK